MDGAEYGKTARTLPESITAEQALLGAVLINNRALDRVSNIVESHHFADPVHGQIYDMARHLIEAGRRADPITMRHLVEALPPINDRLTVAAYLGVLAVHATSIANCPDYARNIRDTYTRRQIVRIGEDMAHAAINATIDDTPSEIIVNVESALFALAEKTDNEQEAMTLDAAMQIAAKTIDAAYQRNGGLAGLATGIPSLDKAIGGLVSGNLLIIAGRPGMGKSGLAGNIAFNIAHTGAGRVGFFSLEMSAEELAMRFLSEQSNIASWQMRQGVLKGVEVGNLMRGAMAFADTPLFIDQSGGLSLAQFTARARRMVRKHKINLIVLDYLQLLGGSRQSFSRVQEVTEITNGLKALAKELAIPVIALAQLSREVEKRPDKRPQLSDLRDSGSIEQDADVVMFVYREEYYVQREEPDKTEQGAHFEWETRMSAVRGKAEVIIAKHRHAPTSTVRLAFDGTTTTFSEAAL